MIKNYSLITLASIALAIDIGFARLGYGLTLPAMKESLDGSFGLYGIIATLHLGGYLFGSLIAPAVLRRLDWKYAFVASHGLILVGLIFQSFVTTVEMMALSRILLGIATGMGVLFALGAAMEFVDPTKRLIVSGFVWTGVAVGMMITSPAASWTLVEVERWRTIWLISALPTLLVVIAGYFCKFPSYVAIKGANEGATMITAARELRNSIYLLLSYFLYGFSYFVYATFALTDVLERFSGTGLSPTALWFTFALSAGIGSMALPLLLNGSLTRHAMTLSVVIATLGAGVALLPKDISIIIGAVFIGFGLTATPAIASALSRGRVSSKSGPNALAIATIAVAAGQMSGPAITGYSIDYFGISSMIMLVFSGYALASVFAVLDSILNGTRRDE